MIRTRTDEKKTPAPTQSRKLFPKRLGGAEIRRILADHGIRPRKYLGQNFLVDPNVAEKMCRLARVQKDEQVLEIGAGIGSLTSALAATGAQIISVEKDPVLAEIVRSAFPDVLVVCADALEDDILESARRAVGAQAEGPESSKATQILRSFESARSWKLVSNLPYSVGTLLFLRLLEDYPKISSGAVMLQLEVAERLCAEPASRGATAATLQLALFAEARIAARIPRTVFYPQPRVDSAIVVFERRNSTSFDVPRELVLTLIRAGFSSRRKTLKNALSRLKWFSNPESAADIFARAGIDPSSRAEMQGLDGFARLAAAIQEADPSWADSLPSRASEPDSASSNLSTRKEK